MSSVIGVFVQLLSTLPVDLKQHRVEIMALVFIQSPAQSLVQIICPLKYTLNEWLSE